MKKYVTSTVLLSALLMTACNNNSKEQEKTINKQEQNPLMTKSTLPYGVPDFSKIKNSDYKPAIEAGIEKKKKEIEEIANNTESATFDNTLVALEKSGQDLSRALTPFYTLARAYTNDTLQDLEEEIAPKLSALNDGIYLNDKLFRRIKTIYENIDNLNLDAESKRLTEYYYQLFILSGANLDEDKKAEIKKINEELASIRTLFTKKILQSFQESALISDNKDALEGMSTSEIEAAAKKATSDNLEGKFKIPLMNTTQQPALTNLKNRKTRKQLFENSINRASKNDEQNTHELVLKSAELRAKRAQILGFKNYAEWNLQNQMAKTTDAVQELLSQIVPAATAQAKNEERDLQKMINESGENFHLEPWDWNFYAEKLRKQKYNLDENEIKPYFEMNRVLENGVFYAAEKLYGITFEERHDIPVYNEDVRVFEVKEDDGTPFALFYCDLYKRDNKAGGAWMSSLVKQSHLLNAKPVVYNVCNFPKPAPGQPALLSYDNVETLFHEFGHALHGLFADQMYPSLSGTSTARDFVELPSQFNEHWALYPEVLKNYATHYETGETIAQELIDKIKNAANFNRGYMMTELVASAQLDLQWHKITADQNIVDVDKFEKDALQRTGLDLKNVPPRYRSPYFNHIWGGGYAAGYYAYIWTDVLNQDIYSWFEENGGLTRENGQRFRDMILSRGNTEDYNEMFENFRGRKYNILPFLKAKGFE